MKQKHIIRSACEILRKIKKHYFSLNDKILAKFL